MGFYMTTQGHRTRCHHPGEQGRFCAFCGDELRREEIRKPYPLWAKLIALSVPLWVAGLIPFFGLFLWPIAALLFFFGAVLGSVHVLFGSRRAGA